MHLGREIFLTRLNSIVYVDSSIELKYNQFFFILLASSLTKSDVLNDPPFSDF